MDGYCGQDKIIEFIRHQLNPDKRVVQGILFFGEKHLGKMTLAKIFSQSLLCQNHSLPSCCICDNCRSGLNGVHPDLFILERGEDQNSLGIGEARKAIDFLSYKPQIANHRILIIDEAELLTNEAQNSLLKILEEPPKESLVILICSQPQRLLHTVLSRLLPVRFSRVSRDKLADWLVDYKGLNRSKAELLAGLSGGVCGLAILIFEDNKYLKNLEHARNNLDLILSGSFAKRSKLIEALSKEPEDLNFNIGQWQQALRNRVLKDLSLGDLVAIDDKSEIDINHKSQIKLLRELQKAAYFLEDLNLNRRLLLENIFLK